MRITKRQLRRIIKEEKARLLRENPSPFAGRGEEVYSALEDVFMAYAPDDVDFLSEEEFAEFEKSVADGMAIMKDRVVHGQPGSAEPGQTSVPGRRR